MKDLFPHVTIPQSEVDELGKGYVLGTYGKYIHKPEQSSKPEEIKYWTKDLGDVMTNELNRFVNSGKINASNMKQVLCILGGDHGKGAFRATLKVVIRLTDGTEIVSRRRVAHIDCKKDTGVVIKNTINDKLRDGLKLIVGCSLSIKSNAFTIHPQSSAQTTCARSIPVSVFVTGDLAFYATVLGKEGSSPSWCYLCNLSAAEWKEDRAAQGMAWTVELIKEMVNSEQTGKHAKGALYPTHDGLDRQ